MRRAESDQPLKRASWIASGVFAFGLIVLFLWLIPEDPDGRWLILVLAGIVVGGAVAGLQLAWLSCPAALFVVLALKSASDCPDCGGGAEEIPLAAYHAVFGAVAAIAGTTGALVSFAVSRFVRIERDAWTGPLLIAGMAMFIVAIALSVARASDQSDRNGDVVNQTDGVRYREGRLLDDFESKLADAASSFEGEPAVSLGARAAGYNLVAVQQGAGDLALIYGHCGPLPCAIPLSLNVKRWCRIPAEFAAGTAPFEVLPGGSILQRSRHGLSQVTVWTGNVSVTIHSSGVLPEDREELPSMLRTVEGEPLPPPAEPTC